MNYLKKIEGRTRQLISHFQLLNYIELVFTTKEAEMPAALNDFELR